MSEKFFVGQDLTGVEDNGLQRPISRVTLKVDDENVLTAGNDTGFELVADCPHATQVMVNAILAGVRGYQYRMFTADDAGLDPAAELGDGVTANGMYSVLSRISEDGSGFPSISAPGEAELEDEYPAAGPMTQAFDRKIAETRSSITKTAEEIRLEVQNEVKGLSSSITVKLDNITSRVQGAEGDISTLTQTASRLQSQITSSDGKISTLTQTVNSFSSEISGLAGDISSINQKVNSITLSVRNGFDYSEITLSGNGIGVQSETIQFTGDVVFESDLRSGNTTISGDCITTGEVSANYIRLGGSMTVYQNLYSANPDVGGYLGYINGQTADGSITQGIGVMNSGSTGQLICSSGGARIGYGRSSSVTCTSGQVYLTANNIVANGTLTKSDGTVITSDRNKKEDIREDVERYLQIFNNLRPVSYRLKNRKRRHLGFIAQEVELSMIDAEIQSEDFGGLVVDRKNGYGLRYEEFIPLLTAKVQELDRKVNRLTI